MMTLDNIALTRRGRRIVEDVSLSVVPGQLLAIVGPNGAGKSTLLAAMSADLLPSAGTIRLDDRDLHRWTPLDLARRRAVMPQAARLGFSLPVHDVVALGRSPFERSHTRAENTAAVARALRVADVTHLAHRSYEALSGGEQQRVQLARAVAQLDLENAASRPILLLDEPTANLDLAHQHAVLRLAQGLTERGVAVVAILHDLGLAFTYGDLVLVLHEGRAVAHGDPHDVLTPALMRQVFAVEGTIIAGHLIVLGPLAA